MQFAPLLLTANYETLNAETLELLNFFHDLSGRNHERTPEHLPEDRKAAMTQLRDMIADNLPKGFTETITYGMIGFVVPHATRPVIMLIRNFRFKKPEQIPYELIGGLMKMTPEEWAACYEKALKR